MIKNLICNCKINNYAIIISTSLYIATHGFPQYMIFIQLDGLNDNQSQTCNYHIHDTTVILLINSCVDSPYHLFVKIIIQYSFITNNSTSSTVV
jgi:hypothetical protein